MNTILGLIKIYKKNSLVDVFFLILKKIYLIKYSSLLEKKKYEINKKIIIATNSKIIHGVYKNVIYYQKPYFNDSGNKLIGLYEEQVQKKIIELKKKFNLNFLINFGAGDGYHFLGLIKNNFFNKGLAYEVNHNERKNLEKNIKLNNIENKTVVLNSANFDYLKKNSNKLKLKNTLFLVDIEGGEFKLFNSKNLRFFKNSVLIIENHDFFISNKSLVKIFFKLLKKNFNIEILENTSRNPFLIDKFKELSDDERWLMVSEGRKCQQNWIICTPK
jgi:hypothetical protein